MADTRGTASIGLHVCYLRRACAHYTLAADFVESERRFLLYTHAPLFDNSILCSHSRSAGLGGFTTNVLLWFVPRVRHALNRAEARVGQSFSKRNAQLIKFLFATVALLLPVYLLAIGAMVCISKDTIYYRPQLLASMQSYSISQVKEVRPRCRRDRGGGNIALIVTMRDGTSLDLAAFDLWFKSSSQQVLDLLRDRPWTYSEIDSGCPAYSRKLIGGK